MKKFIEVKAPLGMLKRKMDLKAKATPAYEVWGNEIENMMKEQEAFLNQLEYKVVVAESTDPQDFFFTIPGL